jgi:hypothetical protein
VYLTAIDYHGKVLPCETKFMPKLSPYREQPAKEPILPLEEHPVILEMEKIQASTREVRKILETLHEQNLTEAQNSDDSSNEAILIAANRQRLKKILLKESLLDRKIVAEIQKMFGKDSEIYKEMVQAKSFEISEEIIENFLDNLTITSLGLETRGQILNIACKRALVNPDDTNYILDLLETKKSKLSKETLAIVGAAISMILLFSLYRGNIDDENLKKFLSIMVYCCLLPISLVASSSVSFMKTEHLKIAIGGKLSLGKEVLTDAQFAKLKSDLHVKLREWEKYIGTDQKEKKPTHSKSIIPQLPQLRVSPIMEEFETPEKQNSAGISSRVVERAEATTNEIAEAEVDDLLQGLKK